MRHMPTQWGGESLSLILRRLAISDYCRNQFAAVLYSTVCLLGLCISRCFAFTFYLIPLLNDLFEGWNWVNTMELTHSSTPPALCCISLSVRAPFLSFSRLHFYLLSASLSTSSLILFLSACTSNSSVSTSPLTMFMSPCFMNKSELV